MLEDTLGLAVGLFNAQHTSEEPHGLAPSGAGSVDGKGSRVAMSPAPHKAPECNEASVCISFVESIWESRYSDVEWHVESLWSSRFGKFMGMGREAPDSPSKVVMKPV